MFQTILSVVMCVLLTLGTSSAKDVAARTLDNLQTAFSAESNAHERYLAFGKKADEEGYGKAASLFRAVARSEEIHAQNQSNLIRKMEADPNVKSEAFRVNSTKENLETALRETTYGRDTMYPDFWSQARADDDSDAMRTFTYAQFAETGSAKLFSAALGNLAKMRGKGDTYYVCSKCGYITKEQHFDNCPSCRAALEGYEAVR